MKAFIKNYFASFFFVLLFIVLVYAAVDAQPGGTTELRAQVCSATERGVGGLACDGSYPGACPAGGTDYLSCNDNSNEAQDYKVDGAGVEVTITNTAITNCDQITSVQLCYEWWVSNTAGISGCLMQVDADGGASYSNVPGMACPGSSANPGVTCVNVTATETWQCSNFFTAGATGGMAKDFVTRTSSSGPVYTLSTDALYFIVHYTESAAVIVDTSISSSSITFGALDPNTVDNGATDDPITLTNTANSNVAIDVYLNNSNMTTGVYYMPYQNLSVAVVDSTNDDTNFNGPTYINGTSANQGYVENLAISGTVDFYFWHDVPAAQAAGSYTSNVTIHSVADGATP